MGKGKRNRLLHVEDAVGAPQKKQNKNKKQIVWPVWAKRAVCIALLVAVLAGIIVAGLYGMERPSASGTNILSVERIVVWSPFNSRFAEHHFYVR